MCRERGVAAKRIVLHIVGLQLVCGNCRSVLCLSKVWQILLVLLLTVTTLALLVALANKFGLVGIVISFGLPAVVALFAPFFVPLRGKRQR